jgi:DNA-binding transcriptional ArsR family regulator
VTSPVPNAETFNDGVERCHQVSTIEAVTESDILDHTYAALADPTRRALLEALRHGPARISDLAALFPMTFAGVSRQVGVLERAGLLERDIRGREHWITTRPEGLADAEHWIVEQAAFWSRRADQLERRLSPGRRP